MGGGNKDNNILAVVLGIIAAILAPISASLIQLSISRKREFLADASGALLADIQVLLIALEENIF